MPAHEDLPRYKDVAAAKGSDLYAAIALNNTGLAESIYQRCEREAAELLKNAQERSK